MKKITLSLAIAILVSRAFAQITQPAPCTDANLNTVDFTAYQIPTSNKKNISDELARRILNQQFSLLVTGQSTASVGNFASITPTEGKIDFAGNIITEKGSVLTAKVSGKVTDGLMAIFDNSTLNTQFSLDVQYHFLSLNEKTLSYDSDSARFHNQQVESIRYAYNNDRAKIICEQEQRELRKRLVTVTAEKDSLSKLWNGEMSRATPDAATVNSLQFQVQIKQLQEDSLNRVIRELPPQITRTRNLKAKTIGQLDAIEFQLPVEGFKMSWWGVGYKVNNNKFKLFDSTAAYSRQVIDTTCVSHEATLQWSHYTWNAQGFKTRYFTGGVGFGYGDNFLEMEKTDIDEKKAYADGTASRSKSNKFTAYEGLYKKKLVSGRIFADYYHFLFNRNWAAVHLGPQWLMKNKEKPMASLFTGLLLAFKKKEEEKTVLNAELYYQFKDIFKTTETELDLFERNSIGLRFTFPIQFKYK